MFAWHFQLPCDGRRVVFGAALLDFQPAEATGAEQFFQSFDVERHHVEHFEGCHGSIADWLIPCQVDGTRRDGRQFQLLRHGAGKIGGQHGRVGLEQIAADPRRHGHFAAGSTRHAAYRRPLPIDNRRAALTAGGRQPAEPGHELPALARKADPLELRFTRPMFGHFSRRSQLDGSVCRARTQLVDCRGWRIVQCGLRCPPSG